MPPSYPSFAIASMHTDEFLIPLRRRSSIVSSYPVRTVQLRLRPLFPCSFITSPSALIFLHLALVRPVSRIRSATLHRSSLNASPRISFIFSIASASISEGSFSFLLIFLSFASGIVVSCILRSSKDKIKDLSASFFDIHIFYGKTFFVAVLYWLLMFGYYLLACFGFFILALIG